MAGLRYRWQRSAALRLLVVRRPGVRRQLKDQHTATRDNSEEFAQVAERRVADEPADGVVFLQMDRVPEIMRVKLVGRAERIAGFIDALFARDDGHADTGNHIAPGEPVGVRV